MVNENGFRIVRRHVSHFSSGVIWFFHHTQCKCAAISNHMANEKYGLVVILNIILSSLCRFVFLVLCHLFHYLWRASRTTDKQQQQNVYNKFTRFQP